MASPTSPPSGTPSRLWTKTRTTGIAWVLLAIGAMWAIEIVDTVLLDERLQGGGIHPRRIDGLDGVLWAPFLHSDFGHLAGNSVPLAVLGGLISARGFRYWYTVTATVVLAGGLATWALADGFNHVGASGVVFGYFGALLAAAWFERSAAALAGALLAVFLYSSLVVGLIPQPRISWEGHLFGAAAGVVAARSLAEPRKPKFSEEGPKYSWEIDEPWLD